MPPRIISLQLAHPSGFLGRMIGRLMNRFNAQMNAFAVQRLEISPSDRVLELGFGGGVALNALIKHAAFVAGVDRSRDVVKWAKARFSFAVESGRAVFREGEVEAIPFAMGSFERVCSVNTIYFWRSLEAGCSEIHRVLSPGGRVVIGLLPKEWMDPMGYPADVFTPRTTGEIIVALTKVGFTELSVERPSPDTKWSVIAARR